MEMMRVRVMSLTEARMVPVRSSTTCSLMAGEMEACSCGRMARTLSTVWMTLAPGDLKTTTRMERLPLKVPPVWTSATESMTWATSLMRTVPEALAGPTVVTLEVAKLVTPELEVLLVLVPEALALDAALPVEALEVVAPVELPAVAEVEVTAEATDAGRPVAAVALVTGPLLVAMM